MKNIMYTIHVGYDGQIFNFSLHMFEESLFFLKKNISKKSSSVQLQVVLWTDPPISSEGLSSFIKVCFYFMVDSIINVLLAWFESLKEQPCVDRVAFVVFFFFFK